MNRFYSGVATSLTPWRGCLWSKSVWPPPTSSWTPWKSWSSPPAPFSAWGRGNSLQGTGQESGWDGEAAGCSFFCQDLLDFFGGLNCSLVPVEHALPRHQVRSFFLAESFQEYLQGSNDVICVNSGALEKVVCEDKTLAIKKRWGTSLWFSCWRAWPVSGLVCPLLATLLTLFSSLVCAWTLPVHPWW